MSRRTRRKSSPQPNTEQIQRLVDEAIARRFTPPANAKPLPPMPPPRPVGATDPLMQQMIAQQAPAKEGTPMFAPGAPLMPQTALSPGGMPRGWQYPVGYNISVQPRSTENTSFDTLRNLAMLYDGIQLCEQVWLDTVAKLNLQIKPRPEITAELGKSASDSKYSDKIRFYTDFFAMPDPGNGYDLKSWLRAAVRDQLQIDAVAIYIRKTRGGGVYSLELVDGACYNADMEILTKSGWKLFTEVDIEKDLFATRNPETKAFEWQKATYFHEADWDSDQHGELYRFTSHALDLLVTPNHRMLVNSMPRKLGGSSHRERGEVIISAKDLAENFRGATAIPATSEWPAPDVEKVMIPATTPRSREMTFTGDDFAAFMGMYLAEGCAPNGDQVVISQMPKSKGYIAYKELLGRIFGFDPCHTGKAWVIGHKALHDYLRPFGHAHEKFIPEIIKEMSRRQLGIFWHYYVLGDGHINKQSGRETVSTVSKKLADDLQEILQKMGYSASISMNHSTYDTVMTDGRVIRKENKRLRYQIRKRTSTAHLFNVEREAYKGKIYCVSVPNEILYVRHNGKPAWCGNTIKPLIDPRGRRPTPPYPAFQQFIYGVPAGLYTSEEMIYQRETTRTESIYGLSRIERIIVRINQALRKENKDLARFTDGNVPPGLLTPPDDGSQWTPETLLAYQEMWDALLAGNDQARSRIKVMQPGSTVTTLQDPDIFIDFDRFLLNVTAACYSMTMSDLGFTESVNKSSGESQQNVFYRRAVQPLMDRYATLFTFVLRHYFNENDLVVTWSGFEESEDFNAMAASYVALTNSGITSPTTAAHMLNLPWSGEEIPNFVLTKEGPTFLEDAADPGLRKAANDSKLAGLQFAAANPGASPQPAQGEEDDESGESDNTSQSKATKGNAKQQPAKKSTAKSSNAMKGGTNKTPPLQPGDKGRASKTKRNTQPDDDSDEHPAISPIIQRNTKPQWRPPSKTQTDLEAKLARAIVDFARHTKLTKDGVEQPDETPRETLLNIVIDLLYDAAHEGKAIATGLEQRGLISAAKNIAGYAGQLVGNIIDAISEKASEIIDAIFGGGDVDDPQAAIEEAEAQLEDWAANYSEVVAVTEIHGIVEDSIAGSMKEQGLTQMYWVTDGQPCKLCIGNADASPLPIGATWPSGDQCPPSHPRCMCTTAYE